MENADGEIVFEEEDRSISELKILQEAQEEDWNKNGRQKKRGASIGVPHLVVICIVSDCKA